ncbi:enoyl-CoA hydratase-related protein [Actinomycetospora straminea]|uniref:Crotonase/enoyl-CoA hydratase family protein n=1 Tax=Actinomycetospora straminea TaxID=663607 RepID=A0ABP9DUS7_9PSEU|nr:enoyl-CoA hydratase-related protein [Actinomycetospora straminea]MDD7932395.1 enoyl-CoA hydratase-related protein [Actinomycetospora straminea]
MQDSTEIEYSITDGIATIVLDRPDRMNAFTGRMCDELVAACDAIDADDAVRALVVTGRGRAFCAGADLGEGGSTFDDRGRDPAQTKAARYGEVDGVGRDRGGVVALRFAALQVPVIGAINGAAVGVGATMTLPMDVRLAGASARFGFVFARRGIVPEAASSWFLPRVVGISRAMEWAMTGRVFGAQEALDGGLVSRVVGDDELLDTAYGLAREVAENTSAVSVAVTRHMMWSMLSAASPWEAHALDSRAIVELGRDADAAEGVTAFLEKRPPRFPLRRTRDHTDLVPEWPRRP